MLIPWYLHCPRPFRWHRHLGERILTAKNFNALGKENFRKCKISLHILCHLCVVTTVNILLWWCDTWALTQLQILRLEVFHCRCIHRMQFKEYTYLQQKELFIQEHTIYTNLDYIWHELHTRIHKEPAFNYSIIYRVGIIIICLGTNQFWWHHCFCFASWYMRHVLDWRLPRQEDSITLPCTLVSWE